MMGFHSFGRFRETCDKSADTRVQRYINNNNLASILLFFFFFFFFFFFYLVLLRQG